MKILLLGASGFLGSALLRHLRERHEVVGTCVCSPVPGLLRLDLRDHGSVKAFLRRPFDRIVHAAGLVDLVHAEEHPEEAWQINARSAEIIAEASTARVTYFSTDNVFAGTESSYVESDAARPINAYGRSKLHAEQVFLRYPSNTVIRLPILIGVGRFLDRFAPPTAKAQVDVISNPVYIPDLLGDLKRIWELPGVVHYGGGTVVTRYELMTAVQQALQLRTAVVGVAGADVPPGELRPKVLVLKSERHTAMGRPLSEALRELATEVGI